MLFKPSSGECLDHMEDENMKLLTFPVKIEDDSVFLDLPPIAELDQVRTLASPPCASPPCAVLMLVYYLRRV